MLLKQRQRFLSDILSKFLIVVFVGIFSSVGAFALTYEQIKECYIKSYSYEKEGNYKKAIEVLTPVYNNYPNGYTVNLRLGWLYYLWGKYANSEFHYKKALKVVPTSVEAMLGLSLPYMAEKSWSKVESLMYRLLRVDFYNYYGNLRLSLALRKEGKYSIAASVDRKMLSLYPSDVNFLLELALNLYNQGKKAYAYSIFRDILILAPDNKVANDYVKKLEKAFSVKR